jgi:hypothetical protein
MLFLFELLEVHNILEKVDCGPVMFIANSTNKYASGIPGKFLNSSLSGW